MKPLLLKISGLNSFLEEQTIDFEKLTKRGIFGIFGPTGSGKSSVLDALTLALYGKIVRGTKEFINEDCDKAYIYFKFAIKSGQNEKIYVVERLYKKNDDKTANASKVRLYLIENNENIPVAEKVNTVNKTIEDIIGLSFDNFTRSVILPQGKFSEFLKLKGKERREMFEKIFHLEKYGKDMEERLSIKNKDNINKLSDIESKISVYGDVSNDKLEELIENIKNLEERKNIVSEYHNKLSKKYDESKILFDNITELNKYNNEIEILENKKSDINLKRKEVVKMQKALEIKPYIDAFKKSELNFKNINDDFYSTEQKYNKSKIEYENIKTEYENIKTEYDAKMPQLISKKAVIEQMVNIYLSVQSDEKDREKLLESYKSKKNKIKNLEQDLEKNKSLKEIEENNILKYKEIINKSTVSSDYREKILKIYNLFQDIINIEKENNDLNLKYNSYKSEKENKQKLYLELKENLNKKEEEYKNIILSISENEKNKVFERDISNIENCIKLKETREKLLSENKKLKEKKEELLLSKENSEKVKKELEKEIKNWETSNMAYILSQVLNEGEMCPVCGSKNHPKKAEAINQKIIDVAKEKLIISEKQFNDINNEYERVKILLKRNSEDIENNYNEIISINKEYLEEDINNIKIKLNDILEKYNTYNENNIKLPKAEKKLSSELSEIKTNMAELKKDIDHYNDRISEYDNVIENNKNKKDIIKNQLSDINDKFNNIEEVENEKEYILKLDFEREQANNNREKSEIKLKDISEICDITEKNISIINNEITEILTEGKEKKRIIDENKKRIEEVCGNEIPENILKETNSIIKYMNDTELNKKSLKDKAENNERIIKDELIKIESVKKQLEKEVPEYKQKAENKVLENNFDSIDDALHWYRTKEFIDNINYEINSFDNSLLQLKTKTDVLNEKIQGRNITFEELQNIKNSKENYENEEKEIEKNIAVSKSNAENMKEQIKSVESLRLEESKLKKEKDTITSLMKVMKGKKFVEYIATYQLSYITEEASQRLSQITSGRYSLELSDSEFVIKDNFNGGSIRDTNTLSGGEVFLTSFSLALALSSKIQMANNAPLEFFFLDEGFGTLDSSLIDIVMSSLERLHEEHLNVGIITHVEELKERMPVKLVVTPAQPQICGTKIKLEIM